jgi:hypothetical protein
MVLGLCNSGTQNLSCLTGFAPEAAYLAGSAVRLE